MEKILDPLHPLSLNLNSDVTTNKNRNVRTNNELLPKSIYRTLLYTERGLINHIIMFIYAMNYYIIKINMIGM